MNRKLAIIFSIILLGGSSCIVHKVRENKITGAKLTNKKVKIGLLGFSPFVSRTVSKTQSGNVTTTKYRATISLSNTLKSRMKSGRPANQFPVKRRRLVSKEKFLEIFQPYLKITKSSGLEELEAIVEVQGKKIYLKYRDVDYYVLGAHSPPFEKRPESSPSALLTTTIYLWMFTIGTFPYIDRYMAESKFIILDKNFAPIKTFHYKSNFKSIAAWWSGLMKKRGYRKYKRIPGLSPPTFVIENDIRQFEDDFIIFLNSQKK